MPATTASSPPPPAIVANQHIYDDYFREEFTQTLDENILQLLDRVWFRSELVGFENYPQRNNPDRPLIFASNHSGMAFPWDAIVALSHLWRHLLNKNGNISDLPRPLSAPLLSQTALMNPYLVREFWKKCGSVDATTLNFETMMYYQDHNLMLYPEGVPGIGKGFNRKYQIQRLATSMVRLALQHGTDIIPFYTINAEYLNPYAYSFEPINRLTKKIGIPFLPLTLLLLLVIIQPWAFYLAFPAKLTFVMGTRIRPADLTSKTVDELSREEFLALSEQVRQKMQAEMDAAVLAHGQNPYRWAELWQRIKENRRYFPFFLPFAWPAMFTEFERLYVKEGRRSFRMQLDKPGAWLKMLWRNPITLAYFIPLIGWIPLAIKGYKGNKLGQQHKAYRSS
ncbi:1-acyl-sn-glycerol-3-phosphate acyltransferase [Hymenobacter sp. UYAg731]